MKRDVLAEVRLHRVSVRTREHGPGPEPDCAGAGHEAEDAGEGEEGDPGHDIVEDTGGGASAAEATSDNTEAAHCVRGRPCPRHRAAHSAQSSGKGVSEVSRNTIFNNNNNNR